MGYRSAILIVIVVLGILFSMLYISQATFRSYSLLVPINPEPALSEDDAISIAKADIEKKVAPQKVDKFVLFTKYYEKPLSLYYIHYNGTQYYYNSTNNYTIDFTCSGECNLRDVDHLLKGHLFYVLDGSWQDSSIRNCSPFIHTIDAYSGDILWSYVGEADDITCPIQPPDWLTLATPADDVDSANGAYSMTVPPNTVLTINGLVDCGQPNLDNETVKLCLEVYKG